MMRLVSLLLLAALLSGLCVAVPPVPWSPTHTHVEIQFSVDEPGNSVQYKTFSYDFPRLSMRVDSKYLSGPSVDQYVNLTSWWINNTLTILTYVGSLPFCQNLDMGFGMPLPDWFMLNATTIDPGLWLTRQYNKSDAWYYRTVWTRKSAMPDGWFNYFSFNDTGLPFRMNAPSPMGEVVNEYYNFEDVKEFPSSVFELPSECQKSGGTAVRAQSMADALQTLERAAEDAKVMPRGIQQISSHASLLILMARAGAQ